jgi:cytochrome c oxidase assembly factor CtaG
LLGLIAPLLVTGAPLLPLWLGLPRKGRRVFKTIIALPVRRGGYRVFGWLRQPGLTLVLFVLGLWVWHWPPLYDLALSNGLIHDWGEHTTFLAVSLLFWSQLIPSPPLHQRAGTLGRLVLVAGAIAQNIVLAMLIGFATTPIYAPYAHLAAGVVGPLSALQDQQIAAGIMWTFGDLPFGIAFATIIHRWLASIMDEEVQPVPVRSGS